MEGADLVRQYQQILSKWRRRGLAEETSDQLYQRVHQLEDEKRQVRPGKVLAMMCVCVHIDTMYTYLFNHMQLMAEKQQMTREKEQQMTEKDQLQQALTRELMNSFSSSDSRSVYLVC